MQNFNEQLLNAFFYEKHVDLYDDLFRKHYYSIFPAPELFVSFLTATNREAQLLYAKQIIQRMSFAKYNSNLYELYKNLMDLEETHLVEVESKYVPRDHSVHSVYVYLLGMYLFFSFELFNKQLIRFFDNIQYHQVFSRNGRENTFLCFLNSYLMFSFNHDVSYPLELLIDRDGKYKEVDSKDLIQKFNEISQMLINQYSLCEIVFLIGLQIIVDNSKVSLQEVFSPSTISSLQVHILDIADYIRLENIYSYKTIEYYRSVINESLLCIFLENTSTGERYFAYNIDKSSETVCLCDLNKNTITTVKINEIDYDLYKMEVFYPKTKCIELTLDALSTFGAYLDDIKRAAKYLLAENTISYAAIFDDAGYIEFLYNIFKSIEKNVNGEEKELTKQYYECYTNSLFKHLKSKIKDVLSSANINYDIPVEENLKNIYSDISNIICVQEIKESIIDNAIRENGVIDTYNLKPLYRHIKGQYETALANFKTNSFINIGDKEVKDKELEGLFLVYMNDYIKYYSIELKNAGLIQCEAEVDALLKYMPSHSMFDHGMYSSYLVLEAYFKACEISRQSFLFKTYGMNMPDKSIVQTASYSIFIHNIYMSDFERMFNKKGLKHDILKNPFVYFCMFCDNMQIWDRPYRINQGKVELNTSTISSKDIAIVPLGRKLHIQCITSEAEHIVSNFRNELESYLKGGSELISLNICDKL